jgi:hypothetical protein
MIMRNIVQEVTTNPAEERSIDSCQSTTKESPFSTSIVRDGGIGVVKVCEHYNPFTRSEFRTLGRSMNRAAWSDSQ